MTRRVPNYSMMFVALMNCLPRAEWAWVKGLILSRLYRRVRQVERVWVKMPLVVMGERRRVNTIGCEWRRRAGDRIWTLEVGC